MKKIKSTKTILEKNKQKKTKKTMWGNTVAIHSILKKKNYKAKFSTSSILKKINKNNSEKKTQKIEKRRRRRQFWKKKQKNLKKHVGKVKAEFSTSSILKKFLIKIILEKKTCGETL
jgi:hypothetical protein